MIAGRLRYKITIMRPRRTVNEYGEEATVWEDLACVRAERVRMSGTRSNEAAEHFADFRTVWNIRDVHAVTSNWRIRDNEGVPYVIVAVEPNHLRGYNTLVCERLND
mgnify:CR=1 FL=1